VDKWLERNLTPLNPATTDLSFENWLDNTKYSEGRKNQLRCVHERMNGLPKGSRAKVKAFIKRESYLPIKIQGVSIRGMIALKFTVVPYSVRLKRLFLQTINLLRLSLSLTVLSS